MQTQRPHPALGADHTDLGRDRGRAGHPPTGRARAPAPPAPAPRAAVTEAECVVICRRHPSQHPVHAGRDLRRSRRPARALAIGRFNSRASTPAADLGRREAFELAVVPFVQVLVDDRVGEAGRGCGDVRPCSGSSARGRTDGRRAWCAGVGRGAACLGEIDVGPTGVTARLLHSVSAWRIIQSSFMQRSSSRPVYSDWYRKYYERNLDDESRPFPMTRPGPGSCSCPASASSRAGATRARRASPRPLPPGDQGRGRGGRDRRVPVAQRGRGLRDRVLAARALQARAGPAARRARAAAIALITGGASGIGRATARLLADRARMSSSPT